MYFEDMTKYSYHQDGVGEKVKNVGWLENSKGFNASEFQNVELGKILLGLWGCRVVKMRGFHCCDICGSKSREKFVDEDGNSYFLGAAEFRVNSKDNDTVFAAPDMIIHYIFEHNYSPPKDFVRALLE